MTAAPSRWSATALVVVASVLLTFGCVVDGGEPAYGVGYYEPAGVPYGGWGVGYDVAPFHDRDHPRFVGAGPPHAFRPAPASRSIPSIPSRPRPGGGPRGRR